MQVRVLLLDPNSCCGDRNGNGRACKARTCGFESRPQLQLRRSGVSEQASRMRMPRMGTTLADHGPIVSSDEPATSTLGAGAIAGTSRRSLNAGESTARQRRTGPQECISTGKLGRVITRHRLCPFGQKIRGARSDHSVRVLSTRGRSLAKNMGGVRLSGAYKLRGQHKGADDPCKIVVAGALPAVSTNSRVNTAHP
jgi:hypothetical protein